MSGAVLGSGCPYSTSLPLRLGLLPGPGPALLGLAGGTMGAAAIHTGEGWRGLGRPAGGRRPSIAGFRPRLAWRKAYSHSPKTAGASPPTCLLPPPVFNPLGLTLLGPKGIHHGPPCSLGTPGDGKMARTVKPIKPSCNPKNWTLVIPGLSLNKKGLAIIS